MPHARRARLRGNATATRGMTKRQVTSLLGPPHDQNEPVPAADRHARPALIERSSQERGYWHYLDLPDEGRETMITFERGRVVDITTAA